MGARLQPYTAVLPKPLMPVGDLPILEIVIRQLVAAGVDHVDLAVGHMASLIMAVLGDGSGLGVRISYSPEEEPLGTAGPLALVQGLDQEDQDYLVMNGDVLTDLDYRRLLEFHRQRSPLVTIACHRKTVKLELGVLAVDRGEVVGYDEKPELSYPVSMGIYVMSPGVLEYVDRGEYLDLPQLVLRLLDAGKKVLAYPFEGRWLDIGNRDDFERSAREFTDNRQSFLPE
jgi:NDP-sugar pyrophosphorylase family protein